MMFRFKDLTNSMCNFIVSRHLTKINKYFIIRNWFNLFMFLLDTLIELIGMFTFLKNSQNDYGLPIENPRI